MLFKKIHNGLSELGSDVVLTLVPVTTFTALAHSFSGIAKILPIGIESQGALVVSSVALAAAAGLNMNNRIKRMREHESSGNAAHHPFKH